MWDCRAPSTHRSRLSSTSERRRSRHPALKPSSSKPVCNDKITPTGARISATLPTARIALPVKARNHQNSVRLNLVEQAIRKAPHSCSSSLPMDNGKSQRKRGDEMKSIFNCFYKPLRELHADVCIPLLGFVKFRDCLIRPKNGEAHRLGSPAFTCSHGVPAGGSLS
ncbi:hypothetical protein HNQ77_003379 [Silvibacterium bohemicum]|uniref:Uncharacterized protein n=1 Tax=Silvibacterium bohemicum TaxID=1577686 RepID=A0A841K461_9BACT|nr:hypothetical protein [Silvibacterium bohemicum]